jgi:HlyD family secretion protein
LFTIAQDLHRMQVHAAVDEADIGVVVKGQSATFTVDAFRDETFPATVREVRNAPQTAQSVVTYDTVLDVENPDRKLRPGMTANVLILVVEKKQVVVVPNEALRFRPPAAPVAAGTPRVAAGTAVYVPDGAGFTRVPVKAGVSDGNVTEVTGLEPGREVIIDLARGKSRPPTAGASGRGL